MKFRFGTTVTAVLIGVALATRVAFADDAELVQEIHDAYGDPCKREHHNYLLSEIGKRCVPHLSASQKADLLHRASLIDPARRVYLRFAFAGAQLMLLDTRTSITPNGESPDGMSIWHVVGTKNLEYRPDDGTTFPSPP